MTRRRFFAIRGLLCGIAASVCTLPGMVQARDGARHDLTIVAPPDLPPATESPFQLAIPVAPPPPTPPRFGTALPVTPQEQVIVDGQTRFLTSGPAQDRCPRDRVVFVAGLVSALRPTFAGDGAYMCHADALAEGLVAQ